MAKNEKSSTVREGMAFFTSRATLIGDMAEYATLLGRKPASNVARLVSGTCKSAVQIMSGMRQDVQLTSVDLQYDEEPIRKTGVRRSLFPYLTNALFNISEVVDPRDSVDEPVIFDILTPVKMRKPFFKMDDDVIENRLAHINLSSHGLWDDVWGYLGIDQERLPKSSYVRTESPLGITVFKRYDSLYIKSLVHGKYKKPF